MSQVNGGDAIEEDNDNDKDNNDISEDDDNINAEAPGEDGSLSPENIADHVSYINGCPIDITDDYDEDSIENNTMHGVDRGNSQDGGVPDWSLVDPVLTDSGNNSSQCLAEFMNLLSCNELD